MNLAVQRIIYISFSGFPNFLLFYLEESTWVKPGALAHVAFNTPATDKSKGSLKGSR